MKDIPSPSNDSEDVIHSPSLSDEEQIDNTQDSQENYEDDDSGMSFDTIALYNLDT